MRYGILSTVAFSSFFGIYSGILCAAERTFGSESVACPLVAGGTIGCGIGACLPPPRSVNVLFCGSVTASVSALSAYALKQQSR